MIQFSYILSLILPIIQLIHSLPDTYDPILNICDDGVPDVVASAGRTLYIFKSRFFWSLNTNGTTSRTQVISDNWDHRLPPYIDLAFTVTGSNSDWNMMNGHTIFVSGNHWYRFHGQDFISEDSTKFWFKDPNTVTTRESFDHVLIQRNDSIVILSSRKHLDFDYPALMFDDPIQPESAEVMGQFNHLNQETKGIIESSTACYLLPDPSDDASYYLFWQDWDQGFFCRLESLQKSKCSKQKVTSAFNCPPEIELIRKKHFINNWISPDQRFMTHDLLVLIVGFQVGTTLILIILLILLIKQYLSLRKIRVELEAVNSRDLHEFTFSS